MAIYSVDEEIKMMNDHFEFAQNYFGRSPFSQEEASDLDLWFDITNDFLDIQVEHFKNLKLFESLARIAQQPRGDQFFFNISDFCVNPWSADFVCALPEFVRHHPLDLNLENQSKQWQQQAHDFTEKWVQSFYDRENTLTSTSKKFNPN